MKSKEQLCKEIDGHIRWDEKPSVYLNSINDTIFYDEFPFILLSQLKKVPQSPTHHPEGNVWNHTMLVVDEAAKVKGKSRDPKIFMWAALLHDIGKAETTRNKKGKITAYDHDLVGARQTQQFLQEFFQDPAFIDQVTSLVRWHMQILYVSKSMKFADVETMNKEADFNEVALLGYCDRMGRLNPDQAEEEKNIRRFVEKCRLFKEDTGEDGRTFCRNQAGEDSNRSGYC